MTRRNLLNALWDICSGDVHQYVALLMDAKLTEEEIQKEFEEQLPEADIDIRETLRKLGYTAEACDDTMEMSLPEGTLRVYKNIDPNYPGITVTFQPTGCDVELDLVYLESPVTKEAAEVANVNPGDIRIMTYENVYSEDYETLKVISAEDIHQIVNMLMEDK